MRAALATLALLVLAPALACAQDLAGVVVGLRGNASVVHDGGPRSRPVAVNDDIHAGDRITTGEDAAVRILLSPAARARLGQTPKNLAVFLQPSLVLGEESTATILTAAGGGGVVLESGRAGGSRFSVRTANAIARTTASMWVSVDPRTPQVADGSLVALTTICGGAGITSGGPTGGAMRELKNGECISVVDDLSGSVEWRFGSATEHWNLFRWLAGTGRWLRHAGFPAREDCQAAADHQRGLGRVVECRFQTGRPPISVR